jgi:hypothetical protein
MSSTSQRGRPTPATGKGEEGSALIRQRVVAARLAEIGGSSGRAPAPDDQGGHA